MLTIPVVVVVVVAVVAVVAVEGAKEGATRTGTRR